MTLRKTQLQWKQSSPSSFAQIPHKSLLMKKLRDKEKLQKGQRQITKKEKVQVIIHQKVKALLFHRA